MEQIETRMILGWIEKADDDAISQVIRAVIRRYRHVYPGWEAHFLTLPRGDREERKTQLDAVIGFLNRYEE